MSKRKRTLIEFSSFENKDNQENEDVIEESKQETKTDDVKVNINSNTETEDVNILSKQETKKDEVVDKPKPPKKTKKDEDNIKSKTLSLYEEKVKRKTVEETHKRRTFLIENDLSDRLDKLCEGKERGFLTLIINSAIRQALDEFGE